MLKKSDEAEKLLNRFEIKYPDDAWVKYSKSLLMSVKGNILSAFRFFKESGYSIGTKSVIYLILDRKDEALALMKERQNETGKDIRFSRYLRYKNLLWYDNLRDNERFKNILAEEKRRYEIILKKYGDL